MKSLRNYTYKPQPNFVGRAKSKRFFGVEIECYPARRNNYEAFEDSMRRISEWESSKGFGEDQFAYCKRDGSLREGHGIEIVTHPFSYFQMRSKKLFDGLDECGLSSFRFQSTGIHVHIGREGISHLTIAKIVYMFALPQFDHLITTIAQRQWNRYCVKPDVSDMKPYLGRYASRYNAINLNNQHTIEFRMFKGNVKPEAIYRAVEFTHSVVAYCSKTATGSITPESFLDYMLNAKQNKTSFKYPNLRKFIKKEF